MDQSRGKAQSVLALILIIIGVSGLLNQLLGWHLFRAIDLGGMFVLIPGLWFEYSYFSRHKSPKLLVPGGILSTIGLLVLIEDNSFGLLSNYIDSFYIMAPAVGLFQLYLHDKKDRGLLIPVGILTFIAVTDFISEIFGDFFMFMDSSIVWPIVLVVLGVALLMSKANYNQDGSNNDHHKETL